MLTYFKADERPAWRATVSVNGVLDDLSTGYTFQCKIVPADDPTATALLTKTTNITGATGGVATVTWATNELNIAAGLHLARLTATRTSDGANWTIEELLRIRA